MKPSIYMNVRCPSKESRTELRKLIKKITGRDDVTMFEALIKLLKRK